MLIIIDQNLSPQKTKVFLKKLIPKFIQVTNLTRSEKKEESHYFVALQRQIIMLLEPKVQVIE